LRQALAIALEHDLPAAALRAYYNLSYVTFQRERWDEAMSYLERGLVLSRTRGDRHFEWRFLSNLMDVLQYQGDWDAALAHAGELPAEARETAQVGLNIINPLTRIHTSRGDLSAARGLVDEAPGLWGEAINADQQRRGGYRLAQAVVHRAEGRYEEALAAAEEAIAAQHAVGNTAGVAEAVVEAVEAALALDDGKTAQELLARVEHLPPGEDSQLLHAQRRRLGARIAAGRGEREKAEQGFKRGAGAFRELAVPFWLGITLLEHGEWLVGEARAAEAEPLLAEAGEIFERLGAKPWRERLDRVRPEVAVAS
jgi:tetratricopeptide (TPR) repeat protein